MTAEPPLDQPGLVALLSGRYGITVTSVAFLPLGSDSRSFSYRCGDDRGAWFYLKLRSPDASQPDTAAATLVMGRVEGAIPPVPPRDPGFPVRFGGFEVTLFPYVDGRPAWDLTFAPAQWHALGRGVRSLHDLAVTGPLARLPQETYSDAGRIRARASLDGPTPPGPLDPSARGLVRLLGQHRAVLTEVVDRADALAARLSARALPLVCCHGDLHSGNLLVDGAGTVHLLDWDTLSLAPREKDLMFPGGGVGGALDAEGGGELFLQGYGPVEVDPEALAYFRCERIVQDLVAFSDLLLGGGDGGPDRPVMLGHFARQFEPGRVVEVALL